MTAYDGMDAAELREVRDHWRDQVCVYARDYRNAVQADQLDWELRAGALLDAALLMVKRVDGLLKLGVAA